MTWNYTVWLIGGEFITTCCGYPIADNEDNCSNCNRKIVPKGRVARIESVQFINPEGKR